LLALRALDEDELLELEDRLELLDDACDELDADLELEEDDPGKSDKLS